MILLLLIMLSVPITAAAVDPLPASRTPGGHGSWTNIAGVPGGIPYRTTVYTNMTTANTAAQINTAIGNCPSNQVVLLSQGTYAFAGTSLTIQKSGVTVRGDYSGTGVVITTTGKGCLIGNDDWYSQFSTASESRHKNWTNGYGQGTNKIYLTNTTGLTVGNLIFLDQLNDTNTTIYSPANPDGPWLTGEYSSMAYDGDSAGSGRDRALFQLNRISAINGAEMTLYEPLYYPFWGGDGTLVPQIQYQDGTTLIEWSGIENVHIDCSGGTDNEGVSLRYNYACWVKDCDITGPDAHDGYIAPIMCMRNEYRGNYLHGPGSTDDYGVRTRMCSGLLVIDNIGNNCGTLMMVNGVHGSVYAYNFATNSQSQAGFLTKGILTHGGVPYLNLFEGNKTPAWSMDSQWQCAIMNVCFRSVHNGQSDNSSWNITSDNQPITIHETNRYMAVMGCVLGKSGVHDTYQIAGDTTSDCKDNDRVFFLGFRAGGSTGCQSGIYDTIVSNTLIRAANWTSATTTNNGINLEGYTTNDLPSSYFLTSAPTNFGILRWPPVDPTDPTYSDSVTNIPAGYRFKFGTNPPAASGGGGGGGPGQQGGSGGPGRPRSRGREAVTRGLGLGL